MAEITLSTVSKGYSILAKGYDKYRSYKLDKALESIEQEGISTEDLLKTDHRFSSFVRYVRALETCSSSEMLETLTDMLINGIKSEKVDTEPDLFQLCLTRLGELTKTEVLILSKMHNLNMYGKANNEADNHKESRQLENELYSELGIDKDVISSLIHGLTRSGFVILEQGHWFGGQSSYIITDLAHYLIELIHIENAL